MSVSSLDHERGRRQEKRNLVSNVQAISRDASIASSQHTNRHKALPCPPLSFAERWRRFWERPLLNTWLAEICAVSFSVACLVAIVAVLKVYEARSIPKIPFGLTLNAIISILASGSKSSLLLAVAGAISQLKWCWFTNTKRKLEDLQDFDDASRGPWGSLSLLFSINFRSLASVGALVTVLTLAYDPFVQQVLKYPVRVVEHPSHEAFTAKARFFVPDSDQAAFGNALNAGIWAEEDVFGRQPGCPSGNCNWPSFKSVGWCSNCENMTDKVQLDPCPLQEYVDGHYTRLSCNLTLGYGNGVSFATGRPRSSTLPGDANHTSTENFLTLTSQVSWLVNSSNWQTGLSVMGIENPAVVVGFASLGYVGNEENWGASIPTVFRAEHCALTPCERTYSLSTVLGKTTAAVTATNYGSLHWYDVPDLTFQRVVNQTLPQFCWQATPGALPREDWTYVDRSEPYFNGMPPQPGWWVNTPHSAFCPLQDVQAKIAAALSGRASTAPTRGFVPGEGSSQFWDWIQTHPYSDGSSSSTFDSPALQRITATNLTTVAESVAASLTKLGLEMSNETVHGSISTSEVYVYAEWKWLVFPIVLEALGILLLVLTMAVSRMQKTRLWKGSVMPLLYHGLEEGLARNGGDVPLDVFGMEEMSRRTQVVLSGPTVDGRIVLAS